MDRLRKARSLTALRAGDSRPRRSQHLINKLEVLQLPK